MKDSSPQSNEPLRNPTPGLPDLVLRVGFAGSQKLPEDTAILRSTLRQVFETIGRRLSEIAPGTPVRGAHAEARVSLFYSRQAPMLRLVTGLCEGADTLAAEVLAEMEKTSPLTPHLNLKLAAVIPFPFADYRASRTASFQATFDQLAARCEYVLEIDGCYEKPDPDTALAKKRRSRGYRAQSTVLLRHSDIIVAVANPDDPGKAGGTLETVRAALAFELPVVFVHSVTGAVSLLEPSDDPVTAIAMLSDGESDWSQMLVNWVGRLVADPDADITNQSEDAAGAHGEHLLNEYFNATHLPPLRPGAKPEARPERAESKYEWLWNIVTRQFNPPGAKPKSDASLAPYDKWRSRATSLNYHHSGNYRGVFLLNYFLAAFAVACAAFSLVLMSFHDEPPKENKSAAAPHTAPAEQARTLIETAGSSAGASALNLSLLLFSLGLIKFAIVCVIFKTTHAANHGDWNELAVDYRYIAERLRTMFYLPRVGSFQPPAAAPPQYASRVVRQSAADWLFDAIVRSSSPARVNFARRQELDFGTGPFSVTIVGLDPLNALQDVRERWITQQAVYHDRNARTMGRIHTFAEHWGSLLNLAVILFIGIDILITVAATVAHQFHGAAWTSHLQWAERFHDNGSTAWLVFFAALLPAIVASLNGIRFQSECRRLAERSAVMRTILRGRETPTSHSKSLWSKVKTFVLALLPLPATASTFTGTCTGRVAEADRLIEHITRARSDPSTDPGAWCGEVLIFTERIAEDFVQEVAEWSVLYAKELPEP